MKFCNMLSFIENEQLIDSAVFSEEIGFDSISVSDHIVLPEVIDSWYPDTPDGKRSRDLSTAAAKALGFRNRGVTSVCLASM